MRRVSEKKSSQVQSWLIIPVLWVQFAAWATTSMWPVTVTLQSRDAFKATLFEFDAESSADSTMGDQFVREVLTLCLQRLAIEEATFSELGKILLALFSFLQIVIFYYIWPCTQIKTYLPVP